MVAMHYSAIEGFIEDVRDARTNVSKQSDRVPDEVCRAKDTIELPKNLLAVVIHNSGLKVNRSQSHVRDGKGIHL